MSNGAGSTYQLHFVNHSPETANVCVYQKDPDIGNPNVMSLAWFTAAVAQNATFTFEWTVDYSFVWDQTGVLAHGVRFEGSEVVAADPRGLNQITLTTDPNTRAFQFTEPKQGRQPGTLYIDQDGSIPANLISCGIGMSGSGVYVVQAEPNLVAEFTPHPVYFITFGNHKQGQVLDVTTITRAAAQVEFPPNVFEMKATLDALNQWRIETGS